MMKNTWEEKPRPPMPNREIVNHRWVCPEGHVVGEDYMECFLCISGTDRDRNNYEREEVQEEEPEIVHPADRKYEKSIKQKENAE